MRNYKRISISFSRSKLQVPVKLERKKMTDVTNMYRHKITLELSEKSYRNEWTDEMKTALPLVVDKYKFGKNKSISWIKLVENEPLFKHVTKNSVRAFYKDKCQTSE